MDNTQQEPLRKIPVHLIDKHILEFRNAANNKDKFRARFFARGTFLFNLRDTLHERLVTGWDYITANPDSVEFSDLWFQLLERYELICDLLNEHANESMRVEAAKVIFEGDIVNESIPERST